MLGQSQHSSNRRGFLVSRSFSVGLRAVDENDLGRTEAAAIYDEPLGMSNPVNSADVRADRHMMTLPEVAEYLRVHKVTIYRAIKAGHDLGQLRIGRVWRFDRESIARFAHGEEATVKTREEPRVGSSRFSLRFRHRPSKEGST